MVALLSAQAEIETFNHTNTMKTTLFTLALAAIHLSAFAQGKVTFGNDANHLVMLRQRDWTLIAAPQVGTPNDVMGHLTAQLWAGPSAGSMTLQYTMAPAGLAGLDDGRLRNVPVTLNDVPGGAAFFFQIVIWETTAGSFEAAQTGGYWLGWTPFFTGTAGSFAPPPLASMAGWTPGPIILYQTPEPATGALVGLGVASWLLFRRRKQK
jgi:hypothetical protein